MGYPSRAAERIDLPVPATRLAALTTLDRAQLAELKALEVFRLARRADLTHEVEDPRLLGARKEICEAFARNRQLFRFKPSLPHTVGVKDVEQPFATIANVEADGKGVEQPAEDDKGIRLRRCRKHRGERMEWRFRRLHLAMSSSLYPTGWHAPSPSCIGRSA